MRLNRKVDRALWFSSYVQTYLERDVRDLAQVADLATFSRFLMVVGSQVDLVFERSNKLYGLEVKATATPVPRHADGLAKWLDLAGPTARGALSCRVQRPMTLRPGIRAIPWHLSW